MANILVTGGAGFIGSHLVDKLVQKHSVTIVDDLSTGKKKFINTKASFLKAKVQDKKIEPLFKRKKFDYIYHLAAQKNLQYSKEHPVEDAQTNILGTVNIIKLAKKYRVKKIIFYSTAAVYDPNLQPPTKETDILNPVTPYGVGKRVGEKYLEISGVPYTVLRLSNVYGPRQDTKGEGGVIAIFSMSFKKGKAVNIFNSGKQTRDFIFVDDVVDASLIALTKAKNDVVNIATGKETPINKLFDVFCHVANKNSKAKRGVTIQEQERSALLNQKAKRILNWNPKITLTRGIKITYNKI